MLNGELSCLSRLTMFDLFRLFLNIMSKTMVVVGGGMYNYKYEKVKVDYSKYLGPDWKPEYEGTSTIVCNHSSWMVSPHKILKSY